MRRVLSIILFFSLVNFSSPEKLDKKKPLPVLKGEIPAIAMAKTAAELKSYFDAAFLDATTGSNSNEQNINPIFGSTTNGDAQQYYRLADWLNAMIYVWQATGEILYFNYAKTMIDNMISNAVLLAGGTNAGFMGWPSAASYGAVRSVDGTNLWEIYSFRHVAYLLAILKDSPNFVSTQGLSTWYTDTLNFLEVNIAQKWRENNINAHVYRSNLHLASHNMVIYFFLDYLTDNSDPIYREIWQNIAYAGMPNYPAPQNNIQYLLRGNADSKPALNLTDNLAWYQNWQGTNTQKHDVNHAGDTVNNFYKLFLYNAHFTVADMNGIAQGMLDNVWVSYTSWTINEFVDGSGATQNLNQQGAQEYFVCGQFNETLQSNMEDNVQSEMSHFSFAGYLLYNRKIMNDASLFYPEPQSSLVFFDSGLKVKKKAAAAALSAN